MSVVDPVRLMAKYLDATEGELSHDEREVLLFALYCESRKNSAGIANCGIRQMQGKENPNQISFLRFDLAIAADLLAALRGAVLSVEWRADVMHGEYGINPDPVARLALTTFAARCRAVIDRAEGKTTAHPEATEPSSQDQPTPNEEIERLKSELAAKEQSRAQWAETAAHFRRALLRYGSHAENCNANRLRTNEPEQQQCNCGLDANLADAAAQPTAKDPS